jgi:hypothetical protein
MSSLKLERDTIRKGTEAVSDATRDGHLPGTSGKHPIAEKIGTAITGGKGNAGTKGYLMVRILLIVSFSSSPLSSSSLR